MGFFVSRVWRWTNLLKMSKYFTLVRLIFGGFPDILDYMNQHLYKGDVIKLELYHNFISR
jgi:hypothetical protein